MRTPRRATFGAEADNAGHCRVLAVRLGKFSSVQAMGVMAGSSFRLNAMKDALERAFVSICASRINSG